MEGGGPRALQLSEENQNTSSEGLCSSEVRAALSTKAEMGKQPKCPSTDDRIKRRRYTHAMGHYAAIKNEILPFVTTRMDPEGSILVK